MSAPVRTSGAKLVGVATAALSPTDAVALLASLSATAATVPVPSITASSTATITATPPTTTTTPPVTAAVAQSSSKGAAAATPAAAATTGLSTTASAPSKASSSAKQEEQEGALLTLGYVLAQLRLTNTPSLSALSPEQASPGVVQSGSGEMTDVFAAQRSAVAALAEAMHSTNLVLASTAASALGLVSLRGSLKPLLLHVHATAAASTALQSTSGVDSGAVDMAVDETAAVVPEAAVQVTMPPVTETPAVVPTAVAATATTTAATAAASSPAAVVVVAAEPRGSLGGVVSRVVELMGDKDVKVAGRAVIAAGHMARGMPCTEVGGGASFSS